MKTLKLISTFFLMLVSSQALAEWVPAQKVDRMQVLPIGNINFWSSSTNSDCGSRTNPFKVEINQYGVNADGLKMFSSVILSSIVADKALIISKRDDNCRVDSVTLQK
ncbi:hypothetical protein [Grimontia sp. NTOU-MAR1]|uniref:hypothetical protein n=1 Tax=Grimontia sp. NTOU-MAR1 TaxID=3111011 RepID=UPI002DBB6F0D|nr:hypothetical protein [Grimontia sp. NTOU-MAR1]